MVCSNSKESAHKKRDFDEEWEIKKKMFNAETESITKESTEKIRGAEHDAKTIKTREKKAKLQSEADGNSN